MRSSEIGGTTKAPWLRTTDFLSFCSANRFNWPKLCIVNTRWQDKCDKQLFIFIPSQKSIYGSLYLFLLLFVWDISICKALSDMSMWGVDTLFWRFFFWGGGKVSTFKSLIMMKKSHELQKYDSNLKKIVLSLHSPPPSYWEILRG